MTWLELRSHLSKYFYTQPLPLLWAELIITRCSVYIVSQSNEVHTNLFIVPCSLKLKNFVPYEHGNYYIC